jgi:hypothetical protein
MEREDDISAASVQRAIGSDVTIGVAAVAQTRKLKFLHKFSRSVRSVMFIDA